MDTPLTRVPVGGSFQKKKPIITGLLEAEVSYLTNACPSTVLVESYPASPPSVCCSNRTPSPLKKKKREDNKALSSRFLSRKEKVSNHCSFTFFFQFDISFLIQIETHTFILLTTLIGKECCKIVFEREKNTKMHAHEAYSVKRLLSIAATRKTKQARQYGIPHTAYA